MKRNRAFTLIELLAVIVILSVIAIITTPIVFKIIDNVNKEALKNSVYGLTEAATLYYSTSNLSDTIEFTCDESGCKNGDASLKYKGLIKNGKIKLYSDGRISVCIEDEKYSAVKLDDSEVNVVEGICNFDNEEYKIDEVVELSKYNELIENYESQIKSLTENYDSQIKSLNNSLSNSATDNMQQLKTQQDAYELQILELNNQKSQLEADLTGQNETQKEAYETQITALNSKIATTTQELESVKTELSNLQNTGTALAGDILAGKDALVKGSKINGTMANLGNNWVWPNSTNGGKMILDSYTYGNGTVINDMIAAYPRPGYFNGNTKVVISDGDIVNLKGITEDKIAKGQKVLGINGSYTSDANAVAGNMLNGITAYVNGSKITGNMANNGALSSSINAGATFTIPAGYTTGGTVTANTLASQTTATAVAGDLLTGKTAYVNGSKITGSMANNGALSSTIKGGGSYTIPAGYTSGGSVSINHTLKSWTPNYGTWTSSSILYTTDTYTVNVTSLYVLVIAENGGSVGQNAAPTCTGGTVTLITNSPSGLLYYVSKTAAATFSLSVTLNRDYASTPNSTIKVYGFTN